MKIGKASYSGSSKETFKIKDGDNVYRPLPPLGNLADQGRWSMYYRVVWGYKGSDGKNKPFISPYEKNFKTQMVEVDCAAFRRSMRIKDEYNKMAADAKELVKSGGVLTDAIKKELEEKKEEMKAFNVESKHFLNAISLDGKIGLLKIGSRAFKALKKLGQDLEGQGIDICGVEGGRFINLNRSGTGLDTTYTITEYKQAKEVEIDGQKEIVHRSMPHDLDESIIGRLAREAFELDKLYPTPSSEEVAELVEAVETLSEEEAAKVVDRILGKSSQTADANQTAEAKEAVAESQAQAETKVEQRAEAVKEPVETSVTEQKAETTTVASGETVNTTTGEIVEEKQEAAAEESTTQSPPPSSVQSDEDFLAGLKA